MTRLILDAGGVSALAADREQVKSARRRGLLPALVPIPVLVESLTGEAFAAEKPGSLVLTSDAADLRALASVAATPFTVVPV